MITKSSVHFIPGFLGSPMDWKTILLTEDVDLPFEPVFYDFFSPQAFQKIPTYLLPELGDWLNIQAQRYRSPRVLVGYSWGGRLALHA